MDLASQESLLYSPGFNTRITQIPQALIQPFQECYVNAIAQHVTLEDQNLLSKVPW